MCGICGVFDPERKLSPAALETDVSRMMGSFRYRGPDGQGTYFDPQNGVGLGHVRLSIIDLAGGQQPMANAGATTRITFNGEIYNFKSERAELEKKGYPFKTHSDTEVILALYQTYGMDAWQRLRGQFAIGLWDAGEKRLVLVRDRMGEKPLAYAHHNGVLYFASELKALLQGQGVPKALDPSVLGLYLLFTCVPAPHSFVQGVKKLPEGHYLTATANGIDIKPFWKPKTWPAVSVGRPETIVDDFRGHFQDAVAACTVSDVPIGTYLSGGLDSTAVTWGATTAVNAPFHTFAIFNRENHENHPDWKYAQEAAAYLKTEHHNVFYTLPELMRLIPEFIEKSGEPFEGPTALVSFFLAKHARDYVKVVLTGNAGDELLGGYQDYYRRTFRSQMMWQWIDRLMPSPVRSVVGTVAGVANRKLGRIKMPHGERRIDATLTHRQGWFDWLCPESQAPTRRRLLESVAIHHADEQSNYIKRYLLEDLFIYHQHSITTMPDSTGMACSLEARNPFLDHRLVEFIFALPPDYLIRAGENNKFILLKAMESRIPSSILTRKKEGFSGMTADQIVRWIRGEGRSLFRDTLMNSALAREGFFEKEALAALWKKYEEAPSAQQAIYYQIPMWAIVMLELWYQQHVLQKR